MKPSAEMIALHETAADWYLRQQDPAWSPADQSALDAWRQADPRHEAAYRDLARTWNDFSALSRPTLASDRATPAQNLPRPSRHEPRGAPRWLAGRYTTRRLAGALTTACLLLAVAGWLIYDKQAGYRIDVATAHGETRTLDLPDGSRIAVNMDTRLQVSLYPRRREVILERGEAYFQVAHAPEHPFTVTSGDNEVRVVGTVFDVRAEPSQLVVKVQEGRVEVRGNRKTCGEVAVLAARQGVSVGGGCARPAPFEVATDMVGDWRTGQLVFRRTPLAVVARDLARYLGKPVSVADATAGALPVSGFATTAEPQTFLESLPDLLKVRVQRGADGGYRITTR